MNSCRFFALDGREVSADEFVRNHPRINPLAHHVGADNPYAKGLRAEIAECLRAMRAPAIPRDLIDARARCVELELL